MENTETGAPAPAEAPIAPERTKNEQRLIDAKAAAFDLLRRQSDINAAVNKALQIIPRLEAMVMKERQEAAAVATPPAPENTDKPTDQPETKE